MKFDPDKYRRRSMRLPGYDYSRSGVYFVTICAKDRECLFGDVVNGKMRLNMSGRIVSKCWMWLKDQYPYVQLDEWILMPNHLHGIIVIEDKCRGGSRTAPTNAPKKKSLGLLIGAFKTTSTKRINHLRQSPGAIIWQRNYYDHIIANMGELNQIRAYIRKNPQAWLTDPENPTLNPG